MCNVSIVLATVTVVHKEFRLPFFPCLDEKKKENRERESKLCVLQVLEIVWCTPYIIDKS